MRTFRYVYGAVIRVLMVVAILLSLAGVGLNIFNIVEYASFGAGKILPSVIVCALSFVFLVLVLSMFILARYEVTEKHLVARFGLVKSKIEIKSITKFAQFNAQNKLVVYFGDNRYAVIVISPEEYDSFVSAVREKNRAISFEIGDENLGAGK